MSPKCWTAGSAAKVVPAAGQVLAAWHGHIDAENNHNLQTMHPT